MDPLANTNQTGLSILDNLAIQAQTFSCGAAMNLLQLGHVLTEAKPLVPHGEWTEWVRQNAHMPIRTAQQYMQAYEKFGQNQRFAQLGPSQIIKLLPMTDEEREQLLRENDVSAMSAREIDGAIRAQRARTKAETAADAAEVTAAREPDIPPMLLEELEALRDKDATSQAEIERMKQVAQDSMEEARTLRQDNARLTREMQDQEDLLREQQEAMEQVQQDLLNMKSAQARGDAARPIGDELTLDIFSQAVREFMGLVARMPYMQGTFAAMKQQEKRAYSDLLATVEGWTEGARQALECYCVEGGVTIA